MIPLSEISRYTLYVDEIEFSSDVEWMREICQALGQGSMREICLNPGKHTKAINESCHWCSQFGYDGVITRKPEPGWFLHWQRILHLLTVSLCINLMESKWQSIAADIFIYSLPTFLTWSRAVLTWWQEDENILHFVGGNWSCFFPGII